MSVPFVKAVEEAIALVEDAKPVPPDVVEALLHKLGFKVEIG